MTKKEVYEVVKATKADIQDDYRAFEYEDVPGIQLTVATNDDMKEWGYQTGDNCYSGAAYFFPHWAVVGVYRNSNCREVTNEIFSQLTDLIYR